MVAVFLQSSSVQAVARRSMSQSVPVVARSKPIKPPFLPAGCASVSGAPRTALCGEVRNVFIEPPRICLARQPSVMRPDFPALQMLKNDDISIEIHACIHCKHGSRDIASRIWSK